MTSKSKIIQFPYHNLKIKRSSDRDEDIDFESALTHQKFIDDEDYPGLVQYCEQRAEKYPDDPYSQYYLGEAYVLNEQYQKAIEFMAPHHKKDPGNWDYHFVILDALFALSKTEDDFNWIQNPVILRMSSKITDTCYEFLKRKRIPRSIIELHGLFLTEGYVLFSEKDLLKALLNDGRFIVANPEDYLFASKGQTI